MRGEPSVSSHPRISARSMVRGKNRFDSPMLLWSKKFDALVRKASASSAQPRQGIVTPNCASSSRSPCNAINARLLLPANCNSGPDAVTSGGAEARADGILRNAAGEISRAQASRKCEPRNRLHLVIDEEGGDAAFRPL